MKRRTLSHALCHATPAFHGKERPGWGARSEIALASFASGDAEVNLGLAGLATNAVVNDQPSPIRPRWQTVDTYRRVNKGVTMAGARPKARSPESLVAGKLAALGVEDYQVTHQVHLVPPRDSSHLMVANLGVQKQLRADNPPVYQRRVHPQTSGWRPHHLSIEHLQGCPHRGLGFEIPGRRHRFKPPGGSGVPQHLRGLSFQSRHRPQRRPLGTLGPRRTALGPCPQREQRHHPPHNHRLHLPEGPITLDRMKLMLRGGALAISLGLGACAPTPTVPKLSTPDYETALIRAQSLLERGNPIDASTVARQAAEAKPHRPEAFALWGRALMHQQQLPEAAEKMEQARTLGHTERRLFLELASVYDVSRRYSDAIRTFRTYLTGHPDDLEFRHQLGLTLLLAGDPKGAATALKQALTLAPNDPVLTQDWGYALLRSGRLTQAIAVLTPVAQKGPDAYVAALYLGRAYARQGDYRKALRWLDQAVADGKNDPRPTQARAMVHRAAGHHPEALADYQRWIRARPDDPVALVGVAGVLIALDRLDDAEKALRRVDANPDDHPQLRFRMAQIAWRRGDTDAVATLHALAQSTPDNPHRWRELHLAAQAFKDRALAQKALQELRRLGAAVRL